MVTTSNIYLLVTAAGSPASVAEYARDVVAGAGVRCATLDRNGDQRIGLIRLKKTGRRLRRNTVFEPHVGYIVAR